MVGQEQGGDHETALTTAFRLLERDALREDAHRLAMRAFCRLGHRNTALDQYHRCEESVRSELGTEPMAETVELYAAILEGRVAIGQAITPSEPLPARPALPARTHHTRSRAGRIPNLGPDPGRPPGARDRRKGAGDSATAVNLPGIVRLIRLYGVMAEGSPPDTTHCDLPG
jgi:hypothetical protein